MTDLLTNTQGYLATLLGMSVYPAVVPLGQPIPAATYNLITDTNDSTHSGDTHLSLARIQVQIFDMNLGNAFDKVAAIKTALHGKKAPFTLALNSRCEGPRMNGKDQSTGVYGVLIDLLIWHVS